MSEENKLITPSDDLVVLCDDFAYAYDKVFSVVMDKILDRISKSGIEKKTQEQFVARGFDTISDLALRLCITKTSNRDNLALKALASVAEMIGMMAQGGQTIEVQQFVIFYQSLKEILDRAGINIPDYTEPKKPNEQS